MLTRSMVKFGLVVCISALAVMGFMSARAAEHPAGAAMEHPTAAAKPVKECTMEDMNACLAKCSQHCDKNIADLAGAMTALDAAVKAIDAGNTAAAKGEIEKAQKLLKEMKEAQKKCMAAMPSCNDKCPMSGKAIDRMNLPENLTRMCKGKKIGFCTPACPVAWDKLTEEEKEAKVKAVMPKSAEKAAAPK